MATKTSVATINQDQTILVKWTGLAGGDVGEAVTFGQWPDRSVQVVGTFNANTCTIQGSMDGGTTWSTLKDFLGSALTITDGTMRLIVENPLLIRPSFSGAGGSVDVYILGSRA